MAGKKSPKSIESAIFSRIKRWGRGCVVLPANFLDLGSRQAVGVALHRLEKTKSIRRLARGVYDFPIEDPLLGPLSPTIEAITRALSERDRFKLQPSGAYALNVLGLSEQVPAKIVFLTDGESRTLRVGSMTIQLRHTTPRNMAAAGRLSGLIIQALRSVGKQQVTQTRINRLKSSIPLRRRRELLKDIALAPAWMHPILYEIAETQSSSGER